MSELGLDARADARHGHVLTFYSFKGGVGRTMAVANVAYLAAFNGLRVLLMDWDLEAPGLPYYFRGLLEPKHALELRDAPGVLNFLWEWSTEISSASDTEAARNVVASFEAGEPFARCVRPILADHLVSSGGVLHLITAGARQVDTPETVPYEDALAAFSWNNFFNTSGGGLAVEALRNWAKKRYDLILIDSRTGLADVAGICTMQIPDTVALCFVLNRQNIDGVARVAGAIRARRAEAVRIRAVPMRTARKETPEESDARAKAINDLARIGGFSSESVQDDLKHLGVAQAENVPFYEALAPLTVSDPELDPLTLNYVRLANGLLGRQLTVPAIDRDLLETARARLQPRHATVEYLLDLRKSDPSRASSEIARLLAAAQEAQLDGNLLDEDYVSALVETVFAIDADDFLAESTIQTQALDLLRSLNAVDPVRWRSIFVDALEKHLASSASYQDEEVALNLLDEVDLLLAATKTLPAEIKRLPYRRRAAWLLYSEAETEPVKQIIGELGSILSALRRSQDLSREQEDVVLASELDLAQLKGCVSEQEGNREGALAHFFSGLDRIQGTPGAELTNEVIRIASSLHSRVASALSSAGQTSEASQHALQAIEVAGGAAFINNRLIQLIQIVVSSDQVEKMVRLCEIQFSQSTALLTVSYFARAPGLALQFLRALRSLAIRLAPSSSASTAAALSSLALQTAQLLKLLMRRRHTLHPRVLDELMTATANLREIFQRAGLRTSELDEAESMLSSAPRARRRPLSRE